MNKIRYTATRLVMASLFVAASQGMAVAATTQASGDSSAVTPSKAQKIARDAYIYGYSLITTEITRVQMTHVPKAEGTKAPMGAFINVKRYPPADYRGVSAPNADTLYSIVWVDLAEPQVFTHPDMGKRYYLFPMYSLWMPVIASPGSRTQGEGAGTYLLTGPNWHGTVPAGMTQIKSPTRYMVMLGRIYADGSKADYKAVNRIQSQLKVQPLSSYGKAYTYVAPPVNPDPGYSMKDKPQKVILDMGTAGYFNMMADLMCKTAPPEPEDATIIAEMAKIGIVPCQKFDMSKLPAAARDGLKSLPQDVLHSLESNQSSIGETVNGWTMTKGLGHYGTHYDKRAIVAAFGWPANVEQDAVYPYTVVDSTGAKLNGAHDYTLTFAKGELPPVKGFWSITMYEIDKGWWFNPNKLNKFTVSPRDHLVANKDGSVTLYFQHQSPGADKQANWLPAPKGDFLLMLRMYWPDPSDPSILDGTWTPPKVQKVN